MQTLNLKSNHEESSKRLFSLQLAQEAAGRTGGKGHRRGDRSKEKKEEGEPKIIFPEQKLL